MTMNARRAAHFLLVPELADSPPNGALVRAYQSAGLAVDLFAPGDGHFPHGYGGEVATFSVEYGYRWLSRNGWHPSWRRYSLFSGTAEDPLAVVGILSAIHRRPSIALVDEIKSGSYRGDARESWKKLCRWAIRRAAIRIVNDPSRIDLLREYAELAPKSEVFVYPGGFVEPPAPVDREEQRRRWGVPPGGVVVGLSGGFNLSSGADWLIEAVQASPRLHAVVQPLGADEMTRFLLERLRDSDRIHVETRRLGWREAWSQAAAFDIGMAVYRNPAPQFQHMGTSSNRLCMCLAMGVPVIASRQPSFQFLERYDCGILVESSREVNSAIQAIRERLVTMRENAKTCWRDDVATGRRYRELVERIARLL